MECPSAAPVPRSNTLGEISRTTFDTSGKLSENVAAAGSLTTVSCGAYQQEMEGVEATYSRRWPDSARSLRCFEITESPEASRRSFSLPELRMPFLVGRFDNKIRARVSRLFNKRQNVVGSERVLSPVVAELSAENRPLPCCQKHCQLFMPFPHFHSFRARLGCRHTSLRDDTSLSGCERRPRSRLNRFTSSRKITKLSLRRL